MFSLGKQNRNTRVINHKIKHVSTVILVDLENNLAWG